MNIAFFITPKSNVTYLYDDYTVRQCLEKMRFHGYSAIPVINRQGLYVGTISEGDLLWRLIGGDKEDLHILDLKSTEEIRISDVLRLDRTPPARITATDEELLNKAMDQNFIPVIDDEDVFIGIVTRRTVMQYFAEKLAAAEEAEHE
ncbi:MAG: CBS domain-containing protein [Clostridia bacterium]|nr:CBS domain-containing protein [Clostridia bacterium]MBO7668520.1 CBS domain-containing protein [Bacillota bacterium]MBR3391044.1 CBS domain-containing protein [Bacillota bacterium]